MIKIETIKVEYTVTMDDKSLNEMTKIMSVCMDLLFKEAQRLTGEQSDTMCRYYDELQIIYGELMEVEQ